MSTTLNFTRAAMILNYAQSSVTAQIQALEVELGVPLFDRVGKQVHLTQAGQRLLTYADQLLTLADEARDAVAGDNEPVGTLTISAPESLCTYRLPAVLRTFRSRFPHVQLVFRPGKVSELRQLVSEGTIDVALVMEEPLQVVNLNVEALHTEPVVMVASPRHNLVHSGSVTPADLGNETMLLTEAGCSYRSQFERTLAVAGVYLTTTLEFTSVEAIKQCVMAEMGISVLPEMAVAAELGRGDLVALPWAGGPLQVVTQLLWHADRWVSPALQGWLDITRAAYQTIAASAVLTAGRELAPSANS